MALKEAKITHQDIEGENDPIEVVACIEECWTDAAICNTIRNAIENATGLNQDELDMDKDGVVERNGNSINVLWTSSNGQRSVTTLVF